MPEELGPWDTTRGMVDDIDAFIQNARFGINEQYAQKIQEAVEDGVSPDQLCFLGDLVNAEGELLSSLVYSLGKDWRTEDNGATIVHDTRKNVVTSSRYGVFVDTVCKQLLVDMAQYGSNALSAASWEGLGFHWKTLKMKTLRGAEKDVLMPNTFLGKLAGAAPAVAAPAVAAAVKATPKVAAPVVRGAVKAGAKKELAIDAALEQKLAVMVKNMDMPTFQGAALNMKDVTSNQALLVSVLNESADGYYNSHKA